MRQELLRKAQVALELALQARTLEFQTRHACDARMYFDQARQALQEFAARTRSIASEAARLIATQSAIYEAGELSTFEKKLLRVEEQVAIALRKPHNPQQMGRLMIEWPT
jgi:hypothetical protein